MANLTSDQFLGGEVAKPLSSDTFLGGGKATPYNPMATPPAPKLDTKRNAIQSAAGFFLDPLARLSAEAGQTLGTGIVKIGEQFQSPEERAKTEQRLNDYRNKPTKTVLTGTIVKPINQVTAKDVAGQAISTAGVLSGNPMIGGALMGGGAALEDNQGVFGTAISTIGGGLMGKILEFGFAKVEPEVSKAIQKYGTPMFEKLSNHIPEALKGTYKAMADKVSSVAGRAGNVISNVADKTGITKVQESASKLSGKVSDAATKLFKGTPEEIAIKNITPTPKELKGTPNLEESLRTVDPETTLTGGKVKLGDPLKEAATNNVDLLKGSKTQMYQNVKNKAGSLMAETNKLTEGKTYKIDDLTKNIQDAIKKNKVTAPATMDKTTFEENVNTIIKNLDSHNSGDANKLRQYLLDYNSGDLKKLYGNDFTRALVDGMDKTVSDVVKNPTYSSNVEKLKQLKILENWLEPLSKQSFGKSGLGGFIDKYKVPIGIGVGVVGGASGIPQKILKATTGISLPGD